MKRQRSTLLTVLCILSFLGGAYGIVNGAFTIATASKFEEIRPEYEKARQEMKQEEASADSTKDKSDAKAARLAGKIMDEAGAMISKEAIIKTGIVGIVSSIITLLGALLMFRLNVAGFYTYVVGKIIEIGAPFVLFGAGMLTGLTAAVSGFFGLIFIVLYAFCLKEMKEKPVMDDMNVD